MNPRPSTEMTESNLSPLAVFAEEESGWSSPPQSPGQQPVCGSMSDATRRNGNTTCLQPGILPVQAGPTQDVREDGLIYA